MVEELFEVHSGPSTPGDPSGLDLREIIQTELGERYIGHYADYVGGMFEGYASTPAGGFVLDAEGNVIAFGRNCAEAAGAQEGDEVFFFGATTTLNGGQMEYAIVGAMQAPRVGFAGGPGSPVCGTASQINGPAIADDSTTNPFIVWFNGQSDLVLRSTTPTTPSSNENGYLSDVAFTPGLDAGEVVAIGIASVDPFTNGGSPRAFGDVDGAIDYQYYVVRDSDGEAPVVQPLGYRSCVENHYNTLEGLRSSIAVGNDGVVFAGGTGCTVSNEGHDEAFLVTLDASDLDPDVGRTFGSGPTQSASITEVTTSDEFVLVAGSFTGEPFPGVPVTGDNGDGYVMAFQRDNYNNTTPIAWFTRIYADDDGGPAVVEALVAGGGRVFVSGHFVNDGGVGTLSTCLEPANPLGRGRSFVAALRESDGFLEWVRVDGTQPLDEPLTQTDAIATTSALYFDAAGILFGATKTHGYMQLECTDGATSKTSFPPRIVARTFNLPN